MLLEAVSLMQMQFHQQITKLLQPPLKLLLSLLSLQTQTRIRIQIPELIQHLCQHHLLELDQMHKDQ